jgi:hypothetical protein
VIGPVESHLLAVVGDGIAFFLGVTASGDKVALLPVAAEEGVEVVVNRGFQSLRGTRCACLLTSGEVFLTGLRFAILLSQVAMFIQRVITDNFEHLFSRRFQGLCCLGLFGQCAALQFLRDGTGQVFVDKAFDDCPLVVQDAIDAEIQVGGIELEQFAQERLELDLILIHRFPERSYLLHAQTLE